MTERYLNAFELLLIQKIMMIEYKVKGSTPDAEELKKIGQSLGVKDHDTITKFFNLSSKVNKPSFNWKPINNLIERLGLERIHLWESFKDEKKYKPSTDIFGNKDFIPIGHFSDLSYHRKKQVTEAVKFVLNKIYPDKDLSNLYFDPIEDTFLEEVPFKLKKYYFNTTWYTYFIYNEFKYPKIGRTIVKIGNSLQDVETETFKNRGANNYSGTVEFDKSESFLIFNLKSKFTKEKCAHLKIDVNTGVRPKIALGQYQNIGVGGVSMHFSNVVFEYVDPESGIIPIPKVLDGYDSDFSEIHPAIQKYLYQVDYNYSEPPTKIYSLERLSQFLEGKKSITRDSEKKVKLQKHNKIIISSPKYSITEEVFTNKYKKAIDLLSGFLIERGTKILAKPKEEPRSKSPLPLKFTFYSERIDDCDILILFYFDRVSSNCLLELAMAIRAGKEVYFFTNDADLLPISLQNQNLAFFHIHKFQDPLFSAEWIIDNIDLLFEQSPKVEL